MRKKNNSKIFLRMYAIIQITILLLVINITFFSYNVTAQDKELLVLLTDKNKDYLNGEILEGEEIIINVYEHQVEYDWVCVEDVNINFNNEQYFIDNITKDCTASILAPSVEENTIFSLVLSKDGYQTVYENITVLDKIELKDLKIEHDDYIVDAGKLFSVRVLDENEEPVSGVKVYIESSVQQSVITPDTGIAKFTAPKDRQQIVIRASKTGYNDVTAEFDVLVEKPWFISFIESPYFVVFISLILLMIVIFYVNQRQKKSIFTRAKEITDKKVINKYSNEIDSKNNCNQNIQNSSNGSVQIRPSNDSKVEEIRISRPKKAKEIVPVKTEEDKTEKIIKKKEQQKRDYDWFEGTDEMRYEIDKLTGEVDEEGLDKWYEGVDELKEKVKEKVKKKDKEKNKEE